MQILFLDTCTWLKIELLKTQDLFDISLLRSFSSIAITHEIRQELEHYSLSAIDIKQIIIYPIGDQTMYKHALEIGFDEADASLLSNGKVSLNDIILVTEDRAVLTFGQLYDMQIIQLSDLLRLLTDSNILDKTNFYHLIKFLRDQRNITKNKEKSLLEWLKTFK